MFWHLSYCFIALCLFFGSRLEQGASDRVRREVSNAGVSPIIPRRAPLLVSEQFCFRINTMKVTLMVIYLRH